MSKTVTSRIDFINCNRFFGVVSFILASLWLTVFPAGASVMRKASSLSAKTEHAASGGYTILVEDGRRPLLRQNVMPVFVNGESPTSSSSLHIRRWGGEVVATQQIGFASGNLTLTNTYRTTISGEMVISTHLQSTAQVALFLRSMFTAVEGAQPFWIHPQGERLNSAEYVSPGPDAAYAPLPIIGVRQGIHRYVLASGATWDSPLPNAAEPDLRVQGATLSVPQVGSVEHPVVMQAGIEQKWITILAPVPLIGSAEEENAEDYALELGGQVAIYNVFSGAQPIVISTRQPISLHKFARHNVRAICFASAYWLRVTTPAGRHSLTPAAHYSPGSWSRDSFWTALGLKDSPLERQTEVEILHAYAKAVPREGKSAGRVPLLLSSAGLSGEEADAISFDDESGLYFLIRMYRDAQILHISTALDLPLANLVMRYILTHQVIDGRFLTSGPAPFIGHPFSPNGWLDGYGYSAGDVITSNQGLFVVALEAARRLGVSLNDGLQEQAIRTYRSAYDPKLGYMLWLSSETYRSPDVLIGEALSLYLFDRPLLPDDVVQKTLESQVWTKYGMQVLATKEGGYVPSSKFLNTTNQGHAEEPAGWYQNGGSWLLWEYLAEYAARRHGVAEACQAMIRSIDAEVAINPTSKEFKLTFVSPELTQVIDPNGNRTLGSTDSNRQGYGWNAAILAFEEDLTRRGLNCLD